MVTLHTFCYPSTPYWGKDDPHHKSLKKKPFVLNSLQISYIHSSHHYSHSNVPLSFPNVEPRIFWSTEMTAIPKSTSGKGEITQLFQDLWRVLWLTCSSCKVGQPSQPGLLGWRTRYKQVIGDVVISPLRCSEMGKEVTQNCFFVVACTLFNYLLSHFLAKYWWCPFFIFSFLDFPPRVYYFVWYFTCHYQYLQEKERWTWFR